VVAPPWRPLVAWPSRGIGILWSLGAAVLVVWAATLPHHNPYGGDARPYPVHLDEYWHWGKAKAIAEQGTLAGIDPFSGAHEPPFTIATMKERGFHAYMAAFELVSGLDWMTLVTWEPVGVAVLLAAATWLFAERWHAAPAALLFVAAIPTTLRFLGYGYFVPVGFALPLLVVGLHFLLRWQEGASAWPFVAVTLGLWPIHPMPAGLLAACALVAAALRLRERPVASLLLAAFIVATALVTWPIYRGYILHGLAPALLPPSLDLLKLYSFPALWFAALGVVSLLAARSVLDRRTGITLGAASLALEAVLLYRNVTGNDPFVLYDRSFVSLALLSALVGAVGLAWLARPLARDAQLAARPALRAGVLALVLLAPLGASQASWVEQSKEPTYQALAPNEVQTYEALIGHVDVVHGRAVVDGISDLPFSDITGLHQYSPRIPSQGSTTPELEQFFRFGANDTAFLLGHGISIVVTRREVRNPDLHALEPGIYELNATLLERMGVTPTTPLQST
jgi:hypothetical protein